ncbi:putative ABC transport system permease protein [Leucobacter exalbidus]|uniref:ABC transport system permease protein n=1 Tax=Leucobacter exalbidus TaxID=662960 RepID=A0A940T4Q7_9MICO|nr:ABC transporter permease [Leucobacter exalbidus]MBP1327198.1 putative ABC transport system permease protein [Leucobacter exalbidus]
MIRQLKEYGATIFVTALSTLFAVGLILATGIMSAAIDPELTEGSSTFRSVLLTVSFVFIVIALYVGVIVTTNTFATIIAGRTRSIALMRLVGATANRVRSRVAAEGLVMGAIGSVIGFILATGLCTAIVAIGQAQGWLPEGRDYPMIDPLALGAAVIVFFTTWAAAWAGSRRVGTVSPIAATGASVELSAEDAKGRTGRTVWALLLLIGGAALLGLGIVMSALTEFAFIVAFFGGLLSFTGIAVGAHFIMPPMLRLTGKMLGQGPTGRLAAANAVRFPERSARSTIGLVIGVTLVTMFAVALATYSDMTLKAFDNSPELAASLDQTLAITTGVLVALVGFSALIAAVGLVNTLSMSVLQRTRELGLLRALGFTGTQIRRMVIAESLQMVTAALGLGLVMGIFYGWIAAQTLLGNMVGMVGPSIPVPVIAGVAVFGVLLAIIAAAAPAQRAIRISPVVALGAL